MNETVRSKLINQPELLGEPPIIRVNRILSDEVPTYSVVMPIYNQQTIILQNLNAIVKTTTGVYEIILICDCCDDGTTPLVIDWAESTEFPSNMVSIIVLESTYPLFETAADNCGFLLSRGEYIVEIQADMEMCELGYNERLAKPMRYRNVIGVSGRCCHSLCMSHWRGKIGELVGIPEDRRARRNLFYVSDTCNRGPLLLHRQKLEELGYLDEQNFYLDNSDHDLFARARHYKGWICGYVAIVFRAPLENGSTRKPRNAINQAYLDRYRARSDGGFLREYKSTIWKPSVPFHLVI